MTGARVCAFRVLKAVSLNGAFSPRALDAEIKASALSVQDAALAASRVYGTLARRVYTARAGEKREATPGNRGDTAPFRVSDTLLR